MRRLACLLVTWVLCGLVYPLAVTGLGQWLLPFQANGSLERSPTGCRHWFALIGQQWNRAASGSTAALGDHKDRSERSGENRAVPPITPPVPAGRTWARPASAWWSGFRADRNALEHAQPELAGRPLPADMLTASASGLDPDISPGRTRPSRSPHSESAQRRDRRRLCVAGATHHRPQSRNLGEPRVNVLELNLALDRLR